MMFRTFRQWIFSSIYDHRATLYGYLHSIAIKSQSPDIMNDSLKLAISPQGSVITPASSEYEVARKVYNEMIDRRPDFIVRCANVADVRTAVNFARHEHLTVAVRGGGHNGAGLRRL